MHGLHARYLILIALFLGAFALMAVLDVPAGDQSPQWPVDDSLFNVDGWIAGEARVEFANGAAYVTREFQTADGESAATLSLATSPAAKRIYRAGPEVPFLGNGYTVAEAPSELVPAAADLGALVARRGDDQLLVIHTYGERRGRFGNGGGAWFLNLFDAVLGAPNDYYIGRVMARLDGDDQTSAHAAVALAHSLFPRIATWYAHASTKSQSSDAQASTTTTENQHGMSRPEGPEEIQS